MEILQITIHARDDKLNELLRTCQLISDKTHRESGCKSSQLFRDSNNENFITIEQQWEQWSFLEDFFGSDRFSSLLGAMKWLGQTYEIRFNGGS